MTTDYSSLLERKRRSSTGWQRTSLLPKGRLGRPLGDKEPHFPERKSRSSTQWTNLTSPEKKSRSSTEFQRTSFLMRSEVVHWVATNLTSPERKRRSPQWRPTLPFWRSEVRCHPVDDQLFLSGRSEVRCHPVDDLLFLSEKKVRFVPPSGRPTLHFLEK